MESGKTSVMEETVSEMLKNVRTKTSPHFTLEMYDKMPIFIPVDITEDVVESVA